MYTHHRCWTRPGVAPLLAMILTACASVTPTVTRSITNTPPVVKTPTLPSASLSPAAPGPTAESLLIPGPDVAYQGIEFSLPTTLAGAVRAQVAPAADKLGELYPAYAEFNLVDYNSRNTMFEPQIQVYPVRELGPGAAQTVQELKDLLLEQPVILMTGIGIPILPTISAGQLIDVQIRYLTFTGGSGVRVLTQLAQDSWPINNEGLVYIFQGLTSDGAYYISAFLPVTAPFLPDHVDDSDTVPPVDGTPYPRFGSPNFNGEYSNYHQAITRKLDTTPPEGFAPDLSILDDLIESLQIKSVTTSSADITAEPVSSPTLALTTTPLSFAELGKIAFVSDRDGNDEIYLMNADGSGVRRLTNNPALDRTPAWSPDGMQIAFVSDRDGNDEVYVMNADGSGVRRLTDNPAWDRFPVWSPDGRQIAFVSDRDSPFPGAYEIYIMNADGSNQTRLTNNQTTDSCPTWSADGKQIAFSTYTGSPEMRIDVINSDGSGQRSLIDTPGEDRCPVWSPDGTRIAFSSASGSDSNIYLINTDGSDLINLTNTSSENGSPQWSPDGQHLVFYSRRDGNSEIYRIGADGHGVTNLTNDPAFDNYPAWVQVAGLSSGSDPCLNTLPTRLSVGLFAYVDPDPPIPNNVRSDAGKNHSFLGDIEPGQAMKILDGPKCVDGWVWWKVRALETELTGWTSEGDQKNYWLIPCASENACPPKP